MTHPDPHGAIRHPQGAAPVIVIGITLALVLFASCDQTTPPPSISGGPSPAASDGSVAPTTPSSSATEASGSASTLPAGQTDTTWGRIWDSLPAAFPVYPGATPADEAQTEPVSATFALDGQEARTVASWMQVELELAAYRTEALNGPLEDGSFVLESTGTADCRIEIVATPLGSLTTVTVRYGAACAGP